MDKKVTVVGAGHVGATAAQRLSEKGLSDVVLVDIIEGVPQGKALDLMEAAPIEKHDSTLVGVNAYEATAGSDIAIITAGIPRKPGMSRDDLISTNAGIMKNVTQQIAKYSPDAILIIVSNPLDAMCHVAFEASAFPKNRAIGMAGVRLYRDAFPAMIRSWRAAFGDPEMPFGILSLCTDGYPQTRDDYLEKMLNAGIHIRAVQYQAFLDLYEAGDRDVGFVSTYDLRRRWYHPDYTELRLQLLDGRCPSQRFSAAKADIHLPILKPKY